MTAFLAALGGAIVGLVIGLAAGRLEQRWIASSQIARLHDAIRLRQLWAQARRHEVATLLEISRRRGGTSIELVRELERQARELGLDTDGRALPGFPQPVALPPAEFAELATLSGLQI